MVDPFFSLTNRVIIDPVLQMRGRLIEDPQIPPSLGARLWHFVKSEIVSRITAIFICIFAAADAFIHLLTGIYKGVHFLFAGNCAEVGVHFRKAGFSLCTALVGSVAGAVWPGVFKFFRNSSSHLDFGIRNAPSVIRELGKNASGMSHPFTELKNFWKQSSLSEKHWFVQTFNQDGYEKIRKVLSSTVYRPIVPMKSHKVKWLNETEISSKVNASWQASFFHATSEKALKSILKDGKVEVRHEKAFRGAFVSTRPELSFGKCVLAFKRNIERLSPLEHGFTINEKTYWAGFSRDIPANTKTLACIILNSKSEKERQELEKQCEEWTGRKFEVIKMDDAWDKLNTVEAMGMGIPQEWPEEGERFGQNVLNVMQPKVHSLPIVSLGALPAATTSPIQFTYTDIRAWNEEKRTLGIEEDDKGFANIDAVLTRHIMFGLSLPNLYEHIESRCRELNDPPNVINEVREIQYVRLAKVLKAENREKDAREVYKRITDKRNQAKVNYYLAN